MPKVRLLNGLPNEIIQKYVSSVMYYHRGYMPDWLNKRMKELNITEAEIDLFSEVSNPKNFNIHPIVVYFPELRKHIQNRLGQTGFEKNYIEVGKLKIHITKLDEAFGQISIQCILKTKDDRIITGKTYHQSTFPIADTFFESLIKKINLRL